MKKIIILLLITVMCLPLMACTNEEEIKALNEKIVSLEGQIENLEGQIESLEGQIESLEKDNDKLEDDASKIIGTWETSGTGGISFIFNADGTATYSQGNTTIKITWKYDSELLAYVVYSPLSSMMAALTLVEGDEHGTRYLQYMEYKLYYKDN